MLRRAIMMLLVGTSAAGAVEFEPKDYSPTEGASIRTLRLEERRDYKVVVVALSNRTSAPFNANYECTMLDASGAVTDSTSGGVQTVPPGQEVVAKSQSFKGDPAKVVCRLLFTIPAG